MKIKIDYLAQQLIDEGFCSRQIDSDKLTNRVIELLSDIEFFNNLYHEMDVIEENTKIIREYYAKHPRV